jgi:hypothetical protein
VHDIGAARLCESGLLEHPDIGSWLRSIVEREAARDRPGDVTG